ncbi:protein-glutamate O-methyltransferase CheR [Puniceicoccaceae bacterium K14]|nr:protein-glutamate O-methyltransferase CheR [Puniceicoccaceae bacterium K14]
MNTNISETDFKFVCDFTSQNSAIVINDSKRYLVETRLEPVARNNGYETLSDFVQALRSQGKSGNLSEETIDALTTNETYFFRDFHPFNALKKFVIPELIERNKATKSLSIWSAACSSGQEAYSIAMMLRDSFPVLNDWKIKIMGTDLSPTVLEKARKGRYNQIEVNRGLPASMLVKYFQKDGLEWVIKDDLKANTEFRAMNLIEPWPIMQPFDIIMIRNVLIYFDVEVKRTILKKMASCLRNTGYLFLGTSESASSIEDSWNDITLDKTVAYTKSTFPKPDSAGLN